MDKTVKTRAYSGGSNTPQSNLSEAQEKALELAKKSALLEEVKIKSLEYLNTIEHLQESLKLEQAKSADLIKKISGLESRLKEMLEQESKEVSLIEQEAKIAKLDANVKDLNEMLGNISAITDVWKKSLK